MNEITKIVSKLIPKQIEQTTLKYRENLNMLITTGFKSTAGNIYFKGIRLSDRIIVVYDIGIGYLHPFLNRVTIYTYRDKQIKQIVSKSYSCRVYNEAINKALVKKLLTIELFNEINKGGLTIDNTSLYNFVETLMKDIYKNQIETLKSIRSNMKLLN